MRLPRVLPVVLLSSLLAAGCGGGGGSTGSIGGPSVGDAGFSGRSSTAGVGQASLNLQGGSATMAQVASRGWDLAKTGALGDGTVDWNVTVARQPLGSAQLLAGGYIRVYNGGSAPATIGNVVVNLQRKTSGNKYATVCSDVADATQGDAATSANVLAGASSEGRSSFTESAASGSLQLTDANNNTAWSLVPQVSIPAGQSVDLLYLARFDNGLLGIPQGELVRTEFIVSFGNAGGRGGSGASATNVDINGNGVIDADEANVRSVPTRHSSAVPATQEANSTVVLTDAADNVAPTGTVTLSGFATTIGGGSGVETLYDSGGWPVSVAYDAGTDGGTATNTASLQGQDLFFTVYGPLDPLTLQPTFSYNFLAVPAVDLVASSTVVIPAPVVDPPGPDPLEPGDYRTQSQGGWGSKPAGNNPGAFLAANFATAFPNGLEIGIPGAGGFSAQFIASTTTIIKKNSPPQVITLSALDNLRAYLNGSNGPPAGFTSDTVNPTSTSSGIFGNQMAALALSLGLSDAGVTPAGLGDLKIGGTGTAFDGMTIRQFFAAASTALGGGGLLPGTTFSQYNDLATNLNESFMGGDSISAWAAQHLSR